MKLKKLRKQITGERIRRALIECGIRNEEIRPDFISAIFQFLLTHLTRALSEWRRNREVGRFLTLTRNYTYTEISYTMMSFYSNSNLVSIGFEYGGKNRVTIVLDLWRSRINEVSKMVYNGSGKPMGNVVTYMEPTLYPF